MTADTYETAGEPGTGSYLLALLVPIIGVLLAIVALSRSYVGPGLALLATSGVGAFVAYLLVA